jgi:hypothetical protein
MMPKVFPSVSMQYASQPIPGIASFGTTVRPPPGLDRADGLVDRRHTDRVDRGGPRMLPWQEAAADSGLAVAAGRDEPVRHGAALPLVELPSEDVFVEGGGAIRIVGGDLEVNGSGHGGLLIHKQKLNC